MIEGYGGDWAAVQRMTWEELQALETEYGRPISSFHMRNGHYLVLKVEIETMTDGTHGEPIALAGTTKRKSVGNLHAVRGLVLRATSRFVVKRARKKYRWKWKWAGKMQPRLNREGYWVPYNVVEKDAEVQVGEGVVYNSYNVGKISVEGLRDPLVIVREMDIVASFDREYMANVDLTDLALRESAA